MTDIAITGQRPADCPPHDWESGDGWGVIIGVSKCRHCGRISRASDFLAHEEARPQ